MRQIYEKDLKKAEYFLFDPKCEYMKPRLQGYRLIAGRYVALELVDNRLHSEKLGLDLVLEESRLRYYDPVSGEWLRTPREEHDGRIAQQMRAEAATRRAEEEARARRAAEAEVYRLRQELEELRKRNA